MDRASRSLVVLAGIALVVGACASTQATAAPVAASAAPSVAAPSPEPTASPTPAPTAAPSSAAPASAAAAGALCAKGFDACALPDGTYSTEPFEFPFVVTVAGGDWNNERNWPHGGSISKANKSAILWASAVDNGIVAGTPTPIGPGVDDFIAYLRKFKDFTVSQPTPVTLDGVSGKQVDVLTKAAASKVFFLPEDAFNVEKGEKIRFIVLDQGGKSVILMIDAFEAKDFDAFVDDVAQPMLDRWDWT